MSVFLILFIISAPASALELMYDDFDYGGTAGDLTTVSGGTWSSHSGTGNPVQYVATSLSMAGYSSGIGGSATFANGSGSREDVNCTFTARNSGIVYYAALVNLSTASTASAYFMHLNSSTNHRARLFAQDVSGNLRFGLSTSGDGTYSTTDFSYNTTYLVVAKYDIDTGDSALYVLNSCSATEPATALVTSTGTSGTTVSRIAIRQDTGGLAGTIDDIRVADIWADVVSSCSVTAVTLVSFTATARPSAILLQWETATELDNLGFNLYRAAAPGGPRSQLNASLIPGQMPGSPVGATYEYRDQSARPGTTYYYWLEDVDVYGVATLHGPVSTAVERHLRLRPPRHRLLPSPSLPAR
jgi:hypothetical protein